MILYKYRGWSLDHHRDVLRKSQLFLAPPDKFNDPFDCTIETDCSCLHEEKIKERYIKSLITKNDPNATRTNKKSASKSSVENQLRERLADLSQYEKDINEESAKHYANSIGVITLSARWDSILLWAHYAESHSGISIGFDSRKLLKAAGDSIFKKVSYKDDYPKLTPFDKFDNKRMLAEVYTKATEWGYEKEYRVTKWVAHGSLSAKDRILFCPPGTIEEVVLGINMSEEHRNQVISICDNENIKVFQAVKMPFKFKLSRELVYVNKVRARK